jgi:hypothetical protein
MIDRVALVVQVGLEIAEVVREGCLAVVGVRVCQPDLAAFQLGEKVHL